MPAEDRITKQIEEFQRMGAENKEINVTALAMNALAQAQRDEMDQKAVRKAYWISVGLPPLGLLYALYYGFGSKPDGRRIALNCVIFTLVAVLLMWGASALLLASIPQSSTDQLNNVNVSDLPNQYKDLLQ